MKVIGPEEKVLKSISNYLVEVEDFRMANKCSHKLSDILFIGLLACLSNGEDYEDMVLFSKSHLTFLQEFIDLPNGIPSHDTFRRVFINLHPDLLRTCLTDFGKDIIEVLSEKQICIDGKNLEAFHPPRVEQKVCTYSTLGLQRIAFVSVRNGLMIRAMKLRLFLHC
jgi:hypothetical protein